MKQTAIQIRLINNSSNNNGNNGEQRMTSLEIAELTGKQHKHLMRDIRKMEVAWEKVTQSKFGLSTYQDSTGRSLPCYELTKTECLYIATKFNDEARARLVIRWQQLEMERLPQRLLGCSDEDVLDEADDILGEELDELNRYSDGCYTPTELGKPFGLEGRDLNSFLADQGVIRWGHGQWQLTKRFANKGLTENRHVYIHSRKGHRKLVSRLVWTERGRDFVMNMMK